MIVLRARVRPHRTKLILEKRDRFLYFLRMVLLLLGSIGIFCLKIGRGDPVDIFECPREGTIIPVSYGIAHLIDGSVGIHQCAPGILHFFGQQLVPQIDVGLILEIDRKIGGAQVHLLCDVLDLNVVGDILMDKLLGFSYDDII